MVFAVFVINYPSLLTEQRKWAHMTYMRQECWPTKKDGKIIDDSNQFHCTHFSLKNSLHPLKKWRDDPEITQMLIICIICELKIC